MVASLAAAGATSGCVATARANVGAAVSRSGGEAMGGGALGFGVMDGADGFMLVEHVEVGQNEVLATTGAEYDKSLTETDHPYGLRIRAEAGPFDELRGPSPTPTDVLFAFAAGVWWMPVSTIRDTDRLVLAVEALGGGHGARPRSGRRVRQPDAFGRVRVGSVHDLRLRIVPSSAAAPRRCSLNLLAVSTTFPPHG